jgi:hypothetical protein
VSKEVQKDQKFEIFQVQNVGSLSATYYDIEQRGIYRVLIVVIRTYSIEVKRVRL